MRVISEVSHPQCRITIFAWNNKYLIKFERGLIEQTYKVPQEEVRGDEDVKKLVADQLLDKALLRMEDMEADLMKVIDELYL